MPKRRGKSASSAPQRSAPTSHDIRSFLQTSAVPSTAVLGVLGGSPLIHAGANGGTAASPGLELTLSPDTRDPPPQPLGCSTPSESTSNQSPRRGETGFNREADHPLTGGQEALMATPNITTNSVGNSANLSPVGPPFSSFDIHKPAEVTLDSLWTLIVDLGKSITPQINRLNQEMLKQEEKINNMDLKIVKLEQTQEQKDLDMKRLLTQQEVMIKDLTSLRRKTELLENNIRSNNLRLINFPRQTVISPREMLKKYIMEILGVGEDLIPPFSQVYYLPVKGDQKITGQEQLLNVTDLLESSDNENVIPSTLIITVALAPDKQWLMSMYFKNKDKSFLGQKIQMFPDISRETQKRRKSFLLMKPAVTQLGATFYLRYPCKCVVRYQANKYVFFDPTQLTIFLTSRQNRGI
ncbi:uncharacterized protein LOC115464232 [Microcaecilia unicolor]|uniref:Uncharacterized protein LOC115464232 n=1 Tax=Microcaecilia unicolor TaxID=1415580 RepID=A0A6P7X4E0_9AMPH|nr:uncharacterized protein LOC115464232 [Microcaecilia unicolor]XP_030050486.1 uncharacterized protein LOC115464232 [Microcaecilia unicolor]XP_030050487.1 uncharacterized protein LOC115464232 [Microcaecilia unicolor]XP_030050488.1 uncharacterized protein LOC115464232 [Microcaecilia unicolor]